MFKRPEQPSCLSEFRHINRYWDQTHHSWVAKIMPGEYYVTVNSGEIISTTLGSCVSACIRDKVTGVGGMNHFMLPECPSHRLNDPLDASTRYGSYAMEHLINDILKNGGSRDNLEVKLTGGGRVVAGMSDIGKRNIEFVIDYLKLEKLDVVVQELGSIYPRKVMYYPDSGRLRIKKLRNMHNDTLIRREQAYQNALASQPVSGCVELF